MSFVALALQAVFTAEPLGRPTASPVTPRPCEITISRGRLISLAWIPSPPTPGPTNETEETGSYYESEK